MPTIPWWGLASSAAAPVLLIGGWTVAAERQSGGFDSVRGTISDLAAHGATDRWIMTSALVGLGVCHATTALALRPAARPGRVLFGLGGMATVLVGLSPLPSGDGGSSRHTAAAVVAFSALALWPAVGWRRSPRQPRLLGRSVSVGAALGLSATVALFFVQATQDAVTIGLAERVAAAAQALWPLAVVIDGRRR